MPPLGVIPFEFCDEIRHQKTRIVGLPDGEEIMMLALFVLTQYRLVIQPSGKHKNINMAAH